MVLPGGKTLLLAPVSQNRSGCAGDPIAYVSFDIRRVESSGPSWRKATLPF